MSIILILYYKRTTLLTSLPFSPLLSPSLPFSTCMSSSVASKLALMWAERGIWRERGHISVMTDVHTHTSPHSCSGSYIVVLFHWCVQSFTLHTSSFIRSHVSSFNCFSSFLFPFLGTCCDRASPSSSPLSCLPGPFSRTPPYHASRRPPPIARRAACIR